VTVAVFTDEQQELRRTVRSFLDRQAPEAEVRRVMDTPDGFDRSVWMQMADQLGLQSLAIPEEFGGSGYSFVEIGVVLEEFGRTLLPAPFMSSVVLAANLLLLTDDEEIKKRYLPGIASGQLIATVAATDEWGRRDVEGTTVHANGRDGSWTLTGVRSFVPDGHIADAILLVAHTEAGPSLFVLDAGADGVTRTPQSAVDATRRMARLEFADAQAELVGKPGAAAAPLLTALDVASVGLAVEQVGGAAACLEMSVGYAKVRHQFGRPIGSFQAIRHRCADILLGVESARSAAYHALWSAADLSDGLALLAPMVKAYCSEVYVDAALQNIQIHGGIGFTWEHPAHLYFKRAKSSELLFGAPDEHRALLAERIGI
jgi:alkylation response protein AidB-like acyl-CoA dehydrogenase